MVIMHFVNSLYLLLEGIKSPCWIINMFAIKQYFKDLYINKACAVYITAVHVCNTSSGCVVSLAHS